VPLTFARQLARIFVLASQTKRDSSPRATTGDEAHIPAKTGVEKSGTRKITATKKRTDASVFIISDVRIAAAPGREFNTRSFLLRLARIFATPINSEKEH
jgi:hypothetical protein